MSDKAGIVQDDELQREFESAAGRQSSHDDAAAAAAAGIVSPTRIIRSYDREVVGPDMCAPPSPSYCESANDVALKHRQQLEQQQAAGHGGYGRQNGQANQQQFHQPPQQQQPAPTTRIIRLPANYQVVRVAPSYRSWLMWRLVIGGIAIVFIIIGLIIYYAATAGQ